MLQTLTATILPQLLTIVVPMVVIPLAIRFLPKILPVTGHAFEWVKAKAKQIDNDFAESVVLRLTDLVQATVLSFEATRIESLKEMMADGKITKEELVQELAEVKADAVLRVMDLIAGQKLWDAAMYVFGNKESDLSKWIDTTIEAHVAKLPPSGLQTTKDGSIPAIAKAA